MKPRPDIEDVYLVQVWAWGSNAAWATLPHDMALGAAEVLTIAGRPAVATNKADVERGYLYQWCMMNDVLS